MGFFLEWPFKGYALAKPNQCDIPRGKKFQENISLCVPCGLQTHSVPSRNSLKQRYLFDLILLLKTYAREQNDRQESLQTGLIVSLPGCNLATLASVPDGRDCDRE